MQQIFNILGTDVFVSLFIAMGLGIAIGVERYLAGKTAGVHTYTLVSMGSALFVIISQIITSRFVGQNFDPMRMAAQIIAAVGFLGVGAIFHKDNQVSGVTTAAGLWVSAGVGMACGFGLYSLAIMATLLTLFTFIVLWFIEKQIRKFSRQDDQSNHSL